jgi:hypothetical protein
LWRGRIEHGIHSGLGSEPMYQSSVHITSNFSEI